MANCFEVGRSWALEPIFSEAQRPANMTPYAFQQAGVEYALSRNHCLIGDEPGLGKTAQAIMISNTLGAKRTLVVCPASLRLNWKREIWRWSTIPNVHVYPIMKSSDGVNHASDYVVVSYALLQNKALVAALLALRWDHVILDESHAIKDPRGNTRTKVICAPDMLPAVTGRFTLLSGTPTPNQPIELYSTARLLDWSSIERMSLASFREHYYEEGGGMVRGPVFDPRTKSWSRKLHYSDHVRNVPRNMDELQYRLRKHVMVRRLKSQAMPQLPAKTWHPFPLQNTGLVKQALRHEGWAKAERLYDLDPDHFAANAAIEGSVTTARRLLGEAKAPQVAAYVKDLLESGVEKVIVGAHHRSVLEILVKELKPFGLVYMDGSTSQGGRQFAVDEFQNNPTIRGIVGQSNVLGLGWTLTAAQDVVVAEPDWVPGNLDQLVDRAHRIGQRGSVIGHVPVVADTLDERILATVVKKSLVIHTSLDSGAVPVGQ